MQLRTLEDPNMKQHYLAYSALRHYIIRCIGEIGYRATLVELERVIVELDRAAGAADPGSDRMI